MLVLRNLDNSRSSSVNNGNPNPPTTSNNSNYSCNNSSSSNNNTIIEVATATEAANCQNPCISHIPIPGSPSRSPSHPPCHHHPKYLPRQRSLPPHPGLLPRRRLTEANHRASLMWRPCKKKPFYLMSRYKNALHCRRDKIWSGSGNELI